MWVKLKNWFAKSWYDVSFDYVNPGIKHLVQPWVFLLLMCVLVAAITLGIVFFLFL